MLESLNSLVCNFWEKHKLHINTDFTITGWIFCAIIHIHKDAKYHLDSDQRKQVDNVIKNLFHGLSEDEMDFNQELFWTEYIDFDNKNGSFYGDGFIWKR